MTQKRFRDQLMPDSDSNDMDIDGNDEADGDGNGHGENINAHVQRPVIGMCFDSLLDLRYFYNEFAQKKGFDVRIRSHRKIGTREYITLICGRGGKPSPGSRKSKRIDCKARIRAIRHSEGGVWKISSICEIHNHILLPLVSRLMPCHRRLSKSTKRTLKANDMAGLKVSKNIAVVGVVGGGPEVMGCSAQDCRNYIHKERKLNLKKGDAEELKKFFEKMKKADEDFHYVMLHDEEDRLTNVLWVHPQSRLAYKEFNDVISFDTTYLLNKYKMPFASFVGINHHGQSTLLGCALLSKEDTATFTWLFRTWIEVMGGVPPKCFMTDQSEAMKNALEITMPDTIHRLCIWHIYTKFPKKLPVNVPDYITMRNQFYYAIMHSRDTAEFEQRWEAFIEDNKLLNNDWLKKLYNIRRSWVPVYLDDYFWAGMKSTQRSESMHAYFDGYLNSQSTLRMFVEQYELALRNKFEKELQEDLQSLYNTVSCFSSHPWEKQLEGCLTRKMFERVQSEVHKLIDCNLVPPTDEAEALERGLVTYEVEDRSFKHKFFKKRTFWAKVDFKPSGQYVTCNCKLFPSTYIICCHMMKVFIHRNIHIIPDRYIAKRWRKDQPRRYMHRFLKAGYPCMTDEYMKYRELLQLFDEAAEHAIPDEVKNQIMKDFLEELMDALKMSNGSHHTSNGREDHSDSQSDEERDRPIRDPPIIRCAGRPRTRVPHSKWLTRTISRAKKAVENARSQGRPPTKRSRGRPKGNGREDNTDDQPIPDHPPTRARASPPRESGRGCTNDDQPIHDPPTTRGRVTPIPERRTTRSQARNP